MPDADDMILDVEQNGDGQNEEEILAEQTGEATAVEEPSPQNETVLDRSFPIIGIGASAGGLEAFKEFFTHMPPDSGMAFVLVQHLDPTHESILVDLIKRYTRMEVFQVSDGIKVRPNCIYVIPPNRDMALLHGALHLMEPAARRGLRLPIDFFFRSLAEDEGEKSIGVVLSGTGSDGTLGLKAIKGEGGLAVVQDPLSAKYDGMPRSAISTGLVDFILAPEEMPEQLLNYVKHAFAARVKKSEPLLPQAASSLQKIFILLRNHTGYDFSLYKNNTIGRRIERRMTVNQIDYIADYVRYLQQNPVEVEALFRELLIGVTRFFRDQEAFTALEQKVIPRLFANRQANQPVRVWIPACSTGEEAFSIAIMLQEYGERLDHKPDIQIFATDIDNQAIEKARNSLYPDGIAADVSPERLSRFFVKEGNTYQVKKSLRDMVIFAVQSVIKDPPFSKIDLISCRNLLIYLGPDLQKQVLRLFYYALRPGGFLFLGNSETLGVSSDSFTVVDGKWRVFQRVQSSANLRGALDFAGKNLLDRPLGRDNEPDKSLNMREVTEKVLLEQYAPPCVIVNEQGEILYFHGRTGKYLEPASGKASLNIFRMAREGLRMPLTAAVRKVITQKEDNVYERIRLNSDDGNYIVKLSVRPISKPASMRGLMMVTFEDVIIPEYLDNGIEKIDESDLNDGQHVAVLEQELKSTKEYLQTTIEELETSNEDLRFANEALQSANEELQSTNEELETSQEELQSVNEELVTVNSELQLKIEALTQANNDINNLLTNTRIGTIFLDRNLRIQRFTPTAMEVVNLIDTDQGRPLSHISSNLDYDDLVEDCRRVLDTLESKEIEVQTMNGRWFWMQVLPYRTVENVIDGVVLTFTDITEQKKLQEQLHHLSRAVEQSPGLVIITDAAGRIEYVNPKFTEITGYPIKEIKGQEVKYLDDEGEPVLYSRLWQTIADKDEWHGELDDRRKDGEEYWLSLSIAPVKQTNKVTHYIAIGEDITQRKWAEEELERYRHNLETVVEERTGELSKINNKLQQEIEERQRMEKKLAYQAGLLQHVSDAVIATDLDLQINSWNSAAEGMYGWREDEAVGRNLDELLQTEFLSDTQEAAQQELLSEKTWQGELRQRRKDGQVVHIFASVSLLEDMWGKAIGGVTINRDITRRKQTEAALQESERFFQATLDALTAQVAILNDEGQIVAVNTMWRQFAEANDLAWPDYGLETNYLEICEMASGEDSEEAPTVAEGIRTVLTGEQQIFTLEYPCHSPKEERWFRMEVTSFKNSEAAWVVVAHHNITPLKKRERHLQQIRKHLLS